MQRFGVDSSRAMRTARIAASLYQKLQPQDEAYLPYLAWSAMLHEIGLAVSMTGSHKHGAYIVGNADLGGFTTREQRLMGALVLGQKGNLRKVREAMADLDMAKAMLALRLAVVFMHARADDDLAALRLRLKGKVEVDLPADLLARHPTLAPWFEKEEEAWREIGLPFVAR
jgi:exopolyphosphatase/guanosine-5'-triphosphate,3'-diphosphate pyrophosphatase